MYRKIIGAASVAAVTALLSSQVQPAASHEHGKMCNVILDGDGEAVVQSESSSVLHAGSVACPPEAAATQTVAVAEPTPAPVKTGPSEAVVYFDTGKSELSPAAQAELDQLITDLKGTDAKQVEVAGFTDTQGSPDANKRLSDKRAQAVASQLIAAGLPAQVVDAEGFGEDKLAVATDDNVPERDNRRVEIKVGY